MPLLVGPTRPKSRSEARSVLDVMDQLVDSELLFGNGLLDEVPDREDAQQFIVLAKHGQVTDDINVTASTNSLLLEANKNTDRELTA